MVFFQVKADRDGVLKVMEVAPRIGGASALSRVRGVNLPLLSLYESEGVPVEVRPGTYQVELDRALTNRYRHDIRYRALYVDFDDRLVVHGRLNLDLIKLLYQCVNHGIRRVLVTRHAGDLAAQLKRWRLEGLFDEVHQLCAEQSKADIIQGPDSVFIDDSFSEREAVRRGAGATVLDPSMAGLLLDDKA